MIEFTRKSVKVLGDRVAGIEVNRIKTSRAALLNGVPRAAGNSVSAIGQHRH